MNDKHLVYLSGGITGLSIEEHDEWRYRFQKMIADLEVLNKVRVFNPVDHIEELAPDRMDEKQAMDYDLNMLRKSDLVIMNFNNPASIGTTCEMGIAYEKRIPIIGLNEIKYSLHPWQELMCSKIFTEWDWMIDYFVKHYLNEWI